LTSVYPITAATGARFPAYLREDSGILENEMKKGPIVTAIFTVLALVAVVTAFVTQASPYVTVAQAKQSSDVQLHLAGDVVKDSLHNDSRGHLLTFKLKDQNGDIITVKHNGEIPADLDQVKKVVAIGGVKDGEFCSSKLLVKCPSKYEADKKKVVASSGL
jgi:cytochrome c-type biogenesis protein CcmE